MNERYKELAREAGLLVYNPEGVPTKLEKFAELIVKECCDLLETSLPYNPQQKMIKKHFGVEE